MVQNFIGNETFFKGLTVVIWEIGKKVITIHFKNHRDILDKTFMETLMVRYYGIHWKKYYKKDKFWLHIFEIRYFIGGKGREKTKKFEIEFKSNNEYLDETNGSSCCYFKMDRWKNYKFESKSLFIRSKL